MSRVIRQSVLWMCLPVLLLSVVAGSSVRAEISDAQKDQLKSLAMETRRKSEAERDTIRRARMDLNAAYSDYKFDERKVKAALDRIRPAQKRLLELHLDNQVQLRQILNEQQFQRFSEMTRKMMSGRHGFPGGEDVMWDRWPDKEMLTSLGLSDDQRRQIRALMGPEGRRKGAFEKLRQDSEKMLELYSNYNLDTAAARKLIDSIHQDQIDHSEQHHKRQQALCSILTESQWQRLRKMLDERIREFHRRRARPDGSCPRP